MTLTNLAWSRGCAEILYKLGVRHSCISPGSRNSTLTIAFSEYPGMECFSSIDERSGAFFALGLAKKTQVPVAVISTSGTAAANYFPAVIEANLNRIPLLILTADRPAYLVNTGANQTIDQHDLYGRQIRTCIDMGLPSSPENLAAQLRRGYLNASGLSHNGFQVNPAGPVHLNFPFAEPLLDEKEYHSPIALNQELLKKLEIRAVEKIKAKFAGFPEILEQSILDAEKLLIICGEGLIQQEKFDLVKLAELTGAPILADQLSGLRFGFTCDFICTKFGNYSDQISEPDLILRFGKKPNSKSLNAFMDEFKKKTLLFDPVGRFNDDAGQVHSYSVSDVWNQISMKNSQGADPSSQFQKHGEFLNHLLTLEEKQKKVKSGKTEDSFSEENIVSQLFDYLPEKSNIFIGNSLPIRYVDQHVSGTDKNLNIFANRGASGIDGIISSALGMAAAGKKTDNYLLIGDVSFFHDLNGLQLAKKYKINLTILVLNNGGGQIFKKLPYVEYGIKGFEEFWLTEPDLNIKQTVELFKGHYTKIESLSELKKIILQTIQGLKVMECYLN